MTFYENRANAKSPKSAASSAASKIAFCAGGTICTQQIGQLLQSLLITKLWSIWLPVKLTALKYGPEQIITIWKQKKDIVCQKRKNNKFKRWTSWDNNNGL